MRVLGLVVDERDILHRRHPCGLDHRFSDRFRHGSHRVGKKLVERECPPRADIPVSLVVPIDLNDKLLEYGNVFFRPDAWDPEYYPHVVGL